MKILTKLICLLFIFPAFAMAQANRKDSNKHKTIPANPKNEILPLDPAVRTGKLANGFTYFIRRNTEPKNRVVMYLVTKAGSILEDENQRGLAHFMEHMSFNGTTNFPKNELVNYLQKAGVRFGADLNAYTSFDETVYQLPLPADDNKLIESGVQIMRDWAHNATLDSTEIKKEVGVVLEEKRLGKGAQDRMRNQFLPVILNQSRYAIRLPIGTDEVLNNFTPETLRKFYKDWYRPDLQALIVVGDIDVNQIEKKIKAKFSDLKNPVNERPRIKYTTDVKGQNHFLAITDKEMTSTAINILIKQKASQVKTKADYRYNLSINLFNQIIDERYGELTRNSTPPFIQGGAGISGMAGGLSSYSASVTAKPGELEKGFKAVWRETERIIRYGFTDTELKRAKKNYLSNFASAFKEKNKTNSSYYASLYTQYFLDNGVAPGLDIEFNLVKSDLAGITLQEINELSKKYIKDTDRDILVMAPDKRKQDLPNEETIKTWIQAVRQEKISSYKDDIPDSPLLVSKPIAGKIISEKKLDDMGITELKMNNGVIVLLKPTDFKNNEISYTSFAPGGTSLSSDQNFQSANFASTIVSAGGVGSFSSSQLDKYLAGKQLSVSPYIAERVQGINGFTTPDDIETALQLTYLYFTRPRKDSSIFSSTISRYKAGLANRESNPNAVFNDTVSAVLGNHSIRRTGPSLAKLAEINLDSCLAIYKERFEDAANFTFIFVGNFEVEKLKPLLEEYLGSLPAIYKKEQSKDLGIYTPSGIVQKTVYKGGEPKATVRLVFTGDYNFSAEQNKVMDALSEVLEIKLLERLREDEGGVYSPNVSVVYGKYPRQRCNLTISFGCAPQNVEKLIASTLDEINKIRLNGPEELDIEKYKAEERRTKELYLKSNDFWLNYLSRQLQDKEEIDSILKTDILLNKVTKKSIRQAAQQYITGKNLVRLVLLPESSYK